MLFYFEKYVSPQVFDNLSAIIITPDLIHNLSSSRSIILYFYF